jgi:hypothetical protein
MDVEEFLPFIMHERLNCLQGEPIQQEAADAYKIIEDNLMTFITEGKSL